MTASTLRWPALALIGLLVAIAVGLLATQLVSERIGISSEPTTAGESLTPPHRETDQRPHKSRPSAGTAPTQTSSTGSGYAPSASGDGGLSDGGSGGSDGGDSRSGLKPSIAPPAGSSPAPSPPFGGGTSTSTEPEPGDD